MEVSEVLKEWSKNAAAMRKPMLTEACDVIESLCLEVLKLGKEVDYQKRRQDLKEQEYKTMIVEVQNVVSKYSCIGGG